MKIQLLHKTFKGGPKNGQPGVVKFKYLVVLVRKEKCKF